MRPSLSISMCAALVAVAYTQAAQPSFRGLGDLPGGSYASRASAVSRDGRFIAGSSSSALSGSWREGVIWQPDGTMLAIGDLPGGLPNSRLSAISDDGQSAAGNSNDSTGPMAVRWSAADGLVSLQTPTVAIAISGNGDVIGITRQSDWHGFRWFGGAMTDLGDLPGGGYYCGVRAMSADGSIIVGTSKSADGFEPFIWTAAGGMLGLGDLPGGQFYAVAGGASHEGSMVVGRASGPAGEQAFKWTAGTGMIGLARLPGTVRVSAQAVSDDGSILVGWTDKTGSPGTPERATIWIGDTVYDLKSYLSADLGLDLSGWTLRQATDVSGDGTVIVGSGWNPSGDVEGWVAVIPEPATLSLLALAGLAILRRERK